MLVEGGRDLVALDDRESPVVQLDAFREQLGAQTVAVTRDRIEPELLGHSGITWRCARPQRRWRECCSKSSANTVSADSMNRAAPSGSRHPPRPFTIAVQRSTCASRSPWPAATS